MERYENQSGSSGVIGFEIHPDAIEVHFANGSIYRYTKRSAGSDIISEMCRLARSGKGLNAFISRVARDMYESRMR